MTTIAMKVENYGVVRFAADTRITSNIVTDNTISKIVRNGEYAIGVAGYLKALQLLEYSSLPPVPSGVSDIKRFVSLELAPTVEEICDGNDVSGQFLFAIRGDVFHLDSSGTWLQQADGLYSIGSGSSYALGAMQFGATPREAVEIAKIYDSGSGGAVNEGVL